MFGSFGDTLTPFSLALLAASWLSKWTTAFSLVALTTTLTTVPNCEKCFSRIFLSRSGFGTLGPKLKTFMAATDASAIHGLILIHDSRFLRTIQTSRNLLRKHTWAHVAVKSSKNLKFCYAQQNHSVIWMDLEWAFTYNNYDGNCNSTSFDQKQQNRASKFCHN